jgi:ankyrin repeat protein
VIKELLKRQDVNVNTKNIFDDSWTALHYAVHEGYLEVVKILIEQFNATIDARTAFNKTPFHFACRRGNPDVIRYLIEKGANTSVVDRDGCTPLHYLCESENYQMI